MTRTLSQYFLCFFLLYGSLLQASEPFTKDDSARLLAQASTTATETATAQAGVGVKNQRIAILGGQALFKSASTTLTQEGYTALDKLVADLGRFESIMSIRVIGHTDSIGSAESNLKLSYKRALNIKRHLAKYFPTVNLVATGAGETQPIAVNNTKEGRRRNRRVEIQIIAR